jgi:hypothetical protein
MKKTSVATMIALLAGPLLAGWAVPSHAQMPNINLMADQPGKTPEEKEADEARDKAYKETLRKIPDAKTSSDPWGNVRTSDAPKAPAVKTTAAKKPKATANTN